MFYCMGRKTSRILMGGVLAVCLAAGGVTAAAAAAQPQAVQVVSRDNYEWGLSFQEENQPPVPNLSAEELAPYNAHYYAPEAGKRLYLTFDAGYENGNTTAILDALKKHNAPGAFFVVGPYIRDYPDLVKRMVEEGHIVGNHSWHHPYMTQKSQEEFAQELALVEEQFRETVGQEMEKFYRPPEGKFSDDNLQWAQDLGYCTVFWSLAYVDWNTENQPTAEQAFSKLIPRTHDGAVVLLHSTSSTNAAILDELLTRWEEMGYTFGSLRELDAADKEGA